MSEEKLLTVREVSHILCLSEKDVMDLAENGSIPAYKVGGVYLRFKRVQVEEYRKKTHSNQSIHNEISFKDRVFDFFYYNDFYILSILLIILMLFIIFK
ncbi:MAG: helix-turn-helix domain-containing protein [Candidatus Omnitrophica bacterium]|nr:helix-turn-helix domain-containing protein [Candidatus Omnitrophota bacterium]